MNNYHLYLEHHLREISRIYGCVYNKEFSTEVESGELKHLCKISIRNDGLMIASTWYKNDTTEEAEKQAIQSLLGNIVMYSFDKMTSAIKNLPDNMKNIFLDETEI